MNDTTVTKICTVCKEEKSVSEFNKGKIYKDGYRYECISCRKEFRSQHKEEQRAYSKVWYAENKEKSAEYARNYHITHKAKNNLKSKSWYDKKKEITSEEIKKLYEAEQEQHSDLIRDWWEANSKNKIILDKLWNDATKELKVHKNKIWRLEHPEIISAINRNRRARNKSAKGTHTAIDINNILLLQNNKCAVCRTKLSSRYHVDHIIALVNGGSNDKYNLQILCQPCNNSKHAKDPIDFMQSRGFLL